MLNNPLANPITVPFSIPLLRACLEHISHPDANQYSLNVVSFFLRQLQIRTLRRYVPMIMRHAL